MTRRASTLPRHPFFRAMVLMSNGVAVGCGGATDGGTAGRAGEPGGADGGSAGGASSGAGGTTPPTGAGGSLAPSTGRASAAGTGGAESAGGHVSAGGRPNGMGSCPLAQWNCAGIELTCAAGNGVEMAASCPCDPERPLSRNDCSLGETFVCRAASATADGQTLDPIVPFDCSCVPRTSSCRTLCDAALGPVNGGGYGCVDPPDAGIGDALCGCAFVYLR